MLGAGEVRVGPCKGVLPDTHARPTLGLLTSQHSVLRCPLSRNVKLPVSLTWFSLPSGFLMGTPVSPQVAAPGASPQLVLAGPTPRQGGQNAMHGRQPRVRHGWRHTWLAQATAGQAAWPGRPQGSGGRPGPPAAPHQARRPCQPLRPRAAPAPLNSLPSAQGPLQSLAELQQAGRPDGHQKMTREPGSTDKAPAEGGTLQT